MSVHHIDQMSELLKCFYCFMVSVFVCDCYDICRKGIKCYKHSDSYLHLTLLTMQGLVLFWFSTNYIFIHLAFCSFILKCIFILKSKAIPLFFCLQKSSRRLKVLKKILKISDLKGIYLDITGTYSVVKLIENMFSRSVSFTFWQLLFFF